MQNYREKINQDFSKAAKIYEKEAELQNRVSDEICELIKPLINNDNLIVDIGCGTGRIARNLIKYINPKQIYQTDLADEMLLQAVKNGAFTRCCDMHNMTFKDAMFDIVVSSLAIQWSNNLNQILNEILRVTQNNGKICLATLGDKTFAELKNIDLKKIRLLDFLAHKKIVEIANSLGLQTKSKIIKLDYPNFLEFFKKMKKIGANYKGEKSASFLGKNFFTDLKKSYHIKYPEKENITISWEVIFITKNVY